MPLSLFLEKAVLWILGGLSFLTPFIIKTDISDLANLTHSVFLQTGTCLAFILWMGQISLRSHRALILTPSDIVVLLWLLWSGLSLTWAPNHYEGLTIWAQWLAAASLYLLVRHFIGSPNLLRKFLQLFFFSGVLVSVIAILQCLLPEWMRWIPAANIPASTFVNRMMAAEYILLTLPLGWIFFLSENRRSRDLLYGLGVTIMAIHLSYAMSRSGILFSFMEGMILFFFLLRKRWRQLLIPSGWSHQKTLVTLLCLSVFFIFFNLSSTNFQWGLEGWGSRLDQTKNELFLDQENFPTGGRIIMWKNTTAMIHDQPWIGRGLGNFKVFYPLYARRVIHDPNFAVHSQTWNAHNDYLQTWAELGVIGLALWLGLLILFLLRGWQGVRRCNPSSPFYLAMSLGGIGIMGDALVSFPLEKAVPVFVFFFYWSMMIGHEATTQPDQKFYLFRLPRKIAFILMLILLLFLAKITHWNYCRLESDKHYLRSLVAGQKKDWPQLLSEAEKAYQFNPSNARLSFLLARGLGKAGRIGEALTSYEEGLKAFPNSVNDLWMLGLTHFMQGDKERALFYYQKAVAILPERAEFHFFIADILKKQGKIDQAQKEYQKVFELDPFFLSKLKNKTKSTP